MLKLGVNIDHVATVREARYRGRDTGEPDPVQAALICESAGAHGITAHLREDRRHIQDRDVWKLRELIKTRLNLEMANSPEIVDIALRLKPDIVCIVPERRAEVTTEGGLDVAGNLESLTQTRKKLNDVGIEVSLFISPDPAQVKASERVGSQFIELHTGAFAEAWHRAAADVHGARGSWNRQTGGLPHKEEASEQSEVCSQRSAELARLVAAARQAHEIGLKINAGHGLNYENLPDIYTVPHLIELNIGHSIISRSIAVGLAVAVQEMLRLMAPYESQ